MINSSHNNIDREPQKAQAASFAQVFKALGSANRLAILDELRQGHKTVGKLAKQLGVDASTVSQHLQKLRQVGLVRSEKHGLEVRCHITSHTQASSTYGRDSLVHFKQTPRSTYDTTRGTVIWTGKKNGRNSQ